MEKVASGHVVNSKKGTKCPTTTQNSLPESVCTAIVYVLLLLIIRLNWLPDRPSHYTKLGSIGTVVLSVRSLILSTVKHFYHLPSDTKK